ncbi:type II secretion system protein GspK [Opitutales bacterium]|nr:type II secretion system protein GspK [Opitutales bacterium]
MQNNRGSILVFILALIVLLSILCMRLMQETVQELRHVSQFHKRDDLRMHAYSALDVAVGVLNEFIEMERTLYEPSQGWGAPLSYSEISPLDNTVKWSIELIDESGKVPISTVSEKDLISFFANMRADDDSLVDEDDGKPFFDSFMDWEDSDEDERDEGAEDDYYEDLDFPYFTPGRPIQNWEEFRMIKGFSFEIDEPSESGLFFNETGSETIHMKNFRNCFSFYNEGPVNINTASPYLLRFLCGDDEELAEEIQAGPSTSQGDPYFTNMNDPNLALMRGNRSISTSYSATVFRALISITKGKANFQLHAILALADTQNKQSKGTKANPRSQQNLNLKYPFRILSIRENENLVD